MDCERNVNLVSRKHKGEALTPARWNRGENVESLQKLWDKCCSFHLHRWGKWGLITLKTQGFPSEGTESGSWTHVCASRPFPLTLLSFFPRFQASVQELCEPLNHLRWKKFCVVVSLSLEKEMATHSIALAWRIPGTAEPGGLPSMGSHRVGHDWSDLAAAVAVFELIEHFQASSLFQMVLLKAGSLKGTALFLKNYLFIYLFWLCWVFIDVWVFRLFAWGGVAIL